MLCIICLHNDNNNMYLTFIDTYNTNSLLTYFQPDKQLSVQFTRIKTQDFNTRVAELLTYTRLNNTTLIITRPFNSASSNFINLNLSRRVISSNFKITVEACYSIRDT